jgi:HAD superfamily, subfamily IIIB (Acid phosphatase)
MRTVIFDIDGTLANNEERQKLLDHGNYAANSAQRWAAYFSGIPNDKPVDSIVELAGVLGENYLIVLCTGRGEENRLATEQWLDKHGIQYDELVMRPAGDFRKDDVVKGEMLDALLAEGHSIWLVVDDRNSVVKMWRERGLTCLQCAEGDF